MSDDFFLNLSSNPQAKKLVQSLGLPIPMPTPLERRRAPYEERPLDDRAFVVGGVRDDALGGAVARALVEAGAEPFVVGSAKAFRGPSEAWGRPAQDPEDAPPKVAGLVFDASGLESPVALRALYDFFHPWLGRLARSGRVLVFGRPPEDAKDASSAAARAALEGFVRSVAKEVGRKGATAQLVYVSEGAEARLDSVLRFFASPRSAFITAQPIRITSDAKGKKHPRVRPLEGKVALVTGAARGIGAETVHLLAQEGAHVFCLDRPDDDAKVAAVARKAGGTPLLQDLGEEGAAQKIAAALAETGVDIVVHNAGVTRDKTLPKMSDAQWDLTLDVNLAAIAEVTSALLERDVLRDRGRVVCLSSVAGLAGNVGQTNYAASKAGVVGYVRALAPTLRRRGITVNAIAPGFIETRLTAAMPLMIREGARRLSALGQGGEAEDVAQAILFLSTPGAVGITGSVLRVCGGALVGA